MQYMQFNTVPGENAAQREAREGRNAAKAFNSVRHDLKSQADPDATPLQQWRQRNQSMMLSGNPILQKQALAEQSTYASQMMQANFRDNSPTSLKEFMAAQNNPEYAQHLIDMKTKMFADPADAPITDANKLKDLRIAGADGVPTIPKVGVTPKQLVEQEAWVHGKKAIADIGKEVGLDQALQELPEIEGMVFDQEGNFDDDLLDVVGIFTSIPEWAEGASPHLKSLLKSQYPELAEKAGLYLSAWERNFEPILRTNTGAEAPAHEVKAMMKKYMPNKGDSKFEARVKLAANQIFLEQATRKLAGYSGDDYPSLSSEMTNSFALARQRINSQEIEQTKELDPELYAPNGIKWAD